MNTFGNRLRRVVKGGLSSFLMLALYVPTSFGSELYKITIIEETGTQPSTDWAIRAAGAGGGLGINNAGMVTWRADRQINVNGDLVFEGGIFIGDGLTKTLIASGSNVQTSSINNLGQVAYVDAEGTVPVVRLWNQGAVSDSCINGQSPVFLCFSDTLSDNSRVTARPSSGTPYPFGIVAPVNQIIASASVIESNFGPSNPVISRNGANATWSGGAGGRTNSIVVIDPTAGAGSGTFTFPHSSTTPSEYSVTGLSINNLANTAFISSAGTASTQKRMVGVVSPRLPALGIITVADITGGSLIDFLYSPSINNLNEVAFVARPDPSSINVYAGDISGRQPKPVATRGEVITADNATFESIMQNGFKPQSINDRGQIAFYASILRGGVQRNVILRADPLPGVSPGNPIMPDTNNPPSSGWRFPISFGVSKPCNRSSCYIDPPVAIGYEYKVEAPGPNFATVYIPAPLPNGDSTLQVEFNGQVAPLEAGKVLDFTTVVPGGVSTFRITGIDTTEGLDPANPLAFVTGLTFVPDPTFDFNVTMVPVTNAPPRIKGDVDGDGDVDLNDLALINAALNTNATGPDDPRDLNGDGRITILDARILVTLCTRPRCATQ